MHNYKKTYLSLKYNCVVNSLALYTVAKILKIYLKIRLPKMFFFGNFLFIT